MQVPFRLRRAAVLCLGCVVLLTMPAFAQTPAPVDVAAQIAALQRAIETLQRELATSHQHTLELETQLRALRAELDEERDLIQAEASTLDQTKVESGSKYRVRLSGLAITHVSMTTGAVDGTDLPLIARARDEAQPGHTVTASARQTQVGISVFGPEVRGLRTAAEVRFDFFAGFPSAADGLSAAIMRLRTVSLAAEGTTTSIRAGQEAPFFSPLSPTSVASTAYPALAAAGNLWTWTPQVYVEHRRGVPGTGQFVLQGGVLDPLTGESPASEYARQPTAGERTGWLAPAGRLAWHRQLAGDRRVSVGGGAFSSNQDWGLGRRINGWALTADAEVPLGARLTLSGELYRGTALGGLGGGAHASVLFSGPAALATTRVHALTSRGGWAQLAWRVSPVLRAHIAGGLDRSHPDAGLGPLTAPDTDVPQAPRNASAFTNLVWQPRSNLLLSAEYRRLWTTPLAGPAVTAGHLTFGFGIAF